MTTTGAGCTMFALADCNNFYAACETVFRPELAERPVIVLSNNDGCVIARNAQAKKLGIKMAVPVHPLASVIRQHQVVVCSSNFALYADMSNRVMDVLAGFTPALEMYSIDESFLDVSPIAVAAQYQHAARVRSTVRRWTGIPISIGVGPTKTLAKIANHGAKQLPGGILVLDQEQSIDSLLDALVVEEIWGIGHRRGAWLRQHGIRTALAFKQADTAWLRKHLSVTVARTSLELRGISCLPLSAIRARKQQICVSRSFGRPVESLAEMHEVIAHYAARACEKLRANGTVARSLTVFITTNSFRKNTPQYRKSATIKLPRATAYTPEVVMQAHAMLAKIFRAGYSYHKAGVLLGDLTTDAYEQLELFAPSAPFAPAIPSTLAAAVAAVPVSNSNPQHKRETERAVMAAVDAINGRFGRDTIRLAASGLERPWGMRQAHVSPRYTTRWDELVRVD